MYEATKTFGPIVVQDSGDGPEPDTRISLVDSTCAYDGPCGGIDEMIKALREAANWLEWRRALRAEEV